MKMQQVIHYPSLKTVLMVEKVIKESDEAISKEELKRRLPTKVMHQTLNVILNYLEDGGKVAILKEGIIWIYHEDAPKKLREKIERGIVV
ncbi:hypothetical protein K8R33_01210 [archaeon]|nr:hypothetical protein [archaeon]